MASTAPSRPILRYHGGKWLLADWIISHMPPHRIYVEPFGGAASVLLQKPRSYAEVYNDLCGEVVNLFRVVRDQGEQLRQMLELTPFSRDDYRESYEVSPDPIEQARRTVTRSFMGFGSNAINRKVQSGFRANTTRSGTTPAGDWRGFPDCLPAIIERLRGVVIENRPAIQVIETHDSPETLHYIDPPYVAETRDKGSDYLFEMDDDQHRELAAVLHQVKGAVIVSGYACDLYDQDLYAGWHRVSRQTMADGARLRTEVLWMRNVKQCSLFMAE